MERLLPRNKDPLRKDISSNTHTPCHTVDFPRDVAALLRSQQYINRCKLDRLTGPLVGCS
jgi:hypothetical protein